MPQPTTRRIALLASTTGILGLAALALAGSDFSITGSTFASGGGLSSGGDFSVQGSSGQPATSEDLSGGDFSVSGGFWEPVATMNDPVCLGDCDNSGTVDFNDLVSMLFEFGTPGSQEGCDADETGNVDFNDLVTALFAFGPCP
ncbi:MAG: hypothetical protein RLN60_00665 [Phycisphaerales bacterium]